jgi:hypothetical protein
MPIQGICDAHQENEYKGFSLDLPSQMLFLGDNHTFDKLGLGLGTSFDLPYLTPLYFVIQ